MEALHALPVVLGTVSLLLTVVVVAPLALCCCFRKRRDTERQHLINEDGTRRSYGGTPTSSIQSPDQIQSEPVSSKDVAATSRKGSKGRKKDSAQKVSSAPKTKAPHTEPSIGDEGTKVVITGEQPTSGSNVKKVVFVNEASSQVPVSEEPEQYSSSPQLDQHQVYSLNDFQPFESDTYNGIYNEIQKWVKPLVTNKALHSVYLSYVTPPRTIEKLQKLSQFLQEYGKALRAHKSTPAVTYAPMEPVISALHSEWSVRTDEVASMIVVSEALVEFPQHIVKRAIQLSSEKRTTLVDFICSTPYGMNKHVYTGEGPFQDPELNPFMTRMGFSLPAHSGNLELELEDDENKDRLTAGLILMVATQQH